MPYALLQAEEKAKNAAIEEARQSRYRLSELESQLEMVKVQLCCRTLQRSQRRDKWAHKLFGPL